MADFRQRRTVATRAGLLAAYALVLNTLLAALFGAGLSGAQAGGLNGPEFCFGAIAIDASQPDGGASHDVAAPKCPLCAATHSPVLPAPDGAVSPALRPEAGIAAPRIVPDAPKHGGASLSDHAPRGPPSHG